MTTRRFGKDCLTIPVFRDRRDMKFEWAGDLNARRWEIT